MNLVLGKLMADNGDEITDEQRIFLLLQSAAIALSDSTCMNKAATHDWWFFIAAGVAQKGLASLKWLPYFEIWAERGDPMAIALINKMTELRLKQ